MVGATREEASRRRPLFWPPSQAGLVEIVSATIVTAERGWAGPEAQRAFPAGGRSLHAEELRPDREGPEALVYETSLWTSWRVADLIDRESG